MIKKYLLARYADGGRGEIVDGVERYDCWGLTRTARVDLYGRRLLASRGGKCHHNLDMRTERYIAQAKDMQEIPRPVPGAIIAVLTRGGSLTHVALIVHDVNSTGFGLHALEMLESGARIVPLYRFLEDCGTRTVKFYDDKSLP